MNHRRARHPITPGMQAMDAELAKWKELATEAERIRLDLAVMRAKADPLYDARVAFRDLKSQLNQGNQ